MNAQENLTNPMATEKIGKLIAKFAIPCIVSLLVNSLYNIVDQIFIGQGVGYLGNAATNVAFPMVVISLAFSLLIGDGAAAFLSLKLGQGHKKEASIGIGNSITIVAIVGILFFIIGSIFKKPLLIAFGATENSLPMALDYVKIILIGLPFVMMSTAVNSVIRADGNPKFSMISMLTGAIINTILDPTFIFIFKWGIKGAAVATIIGQIISFFITISYLKKFKSIDFSKDVLKLDFNISKSVLSFGISSFITQIAITVVMIVMNNSLNYYGGLSEYGSDIPLSALGIVMKVNQILTSILVGTAVGSQPIVGFNYGAENYDRVKKTFAVTITIATTIAIIGFIIFMFFPQYIINIFGQENSLYNEFALKCFRIFLCFTIFNGFQIVSGIFFQAIGKPIKAAVLTLSRQVLFFIPAVIIIPKFIGLNGCLFAGPTADFLAFVLAFALIYHEMKHLTEKHEQTMRG